MAISTTIQSGAFYYKTGTKIKTFHFDTARSYFPDKMLFNYVLHGIPF